jgi:anti-sigma regulatory factor (Ser/Thr protein kinase)
MMTISDSTTGVACAAVGADARRSSLELAVVPSAVRTARHWTADLLAQADPPHPAELIDGVVLLVSELVTNAIEAVQALAGDPPEPRVWLAIVSQPDLVRIEVHDTASLPIPARGDHDADEESGRGLAVISALATDWGWTPDPFGKLVWCELSARSVSAW